VQEAIHANAEAMDQTELIKLLEEEMITSAKNLEFERAAQLRDKINEMKGAPVIKSGTAWSADGVDGNASQPKIWQPKTAKRGGRRAAK
jgi:hypothetical protein